MSGFVPRKDIRKQKKIEKKKNFIQNREEYFRQKTAATKEMKKGQQTQKKAAKLVAKKPDQAKRSKVKEVIEKQAVKANEVIEKK